jgi:glyoxylate/hydroxypyruvate reductase A
MSEAPRQGNVLLSVRGFNPARWHKLIAAERDVVLEPNGAADPAIDYAVVWKQPPGILKSLPNLKAIFSIGAGVDHVFADPDLPDVPVVRVVAPNLTNHMREYVGWRVLDHHRQGITYRLQQGQKLWREPAQPPASAVTVGIMGLGQLGMAAAQALLALGFTLTGWSRTEKQIEGITCHHGDAGLPAFLAATDILVVLLPLTGATRGIINSGLLSQLRQNGPLGGPVLINAGRGQLQVEADIVSALDAGTLKEASLDVFEHEPLDSRSALWAHPRVFVTPHAAATSDPAHLAPDMLAQMAAHDRGEALRNVVDRSAGY